MNGKQALALETFKISNPVLLASWAMRHPALKKIPPIYWHEYHRKWKWNDIPDEDVMLYFSMCEAVLHVKRLGG